MVGCDRNGEDMLWKQAQSLTALGMHLLPLCCVLQGAPGPLIQLGDSESLLAQYLPMACFTSALLAVKPSHLPFPK